MSGLVKVYAIDPHVCYQLKSNNDSNNNVDNKKIIIMATTKIIITEMNATTDNIKYILISVNVMTLRIIIINCENMEIL